GRNCRFLQGADTDPVAIETLRQAVRIGQSCQVVLKNYRKNGTAFWNELIISPVRDERGRLTHYIGIQNDITERIQAEERLRRQAVRERLIRTLTERIYQSLDVAETLNVAVNDVRHLLQADRTIIYRFTPDWGGYVAVESVGEGWTPVLDMQITDTCFRDGHVPLYQQGRVRVIPNIHTEGLAPCHVALLDQFQVKANLVVPILQANHLWGLLIAQQCDAPRDWQADEVILLQELSVQLAIALEQSELHQKLQNELEERRQTEAALRQSEARLREQTLHLEQTLAELKHAQTQLVQSEKMSSLGQLVAGVAHEINNPVSFVCGNLKYVQDYTQDLLDIITLYQTYAPALPAEAQAILETKELDFMMDDLPKSISSMQVGAERIREIINSLRNFSRLDEAEVKAVNIHEGLDNTLMILASRMRETPTDIAIQVVKAYGDLPEVKCYPGQLNQVFMNILSNAIDALSDRRHLPKAFANAAINGATNSAANPAANSVDSTVNPSPLPVITLRTECLEGDRIAIHITDNGIGVPAEIQPHIFDPFFTTKPFGQGTGLGLAISYQIIVGKHQGQLTCQPHSPTGTTFTIEIPITQAGLD
ncbi:MAG TPA: ATP-binding protein, partial [Chroococcidiopsis sp.]